MAISSMVAKKRNDSVNRSSGLGSEPTFSVDREASWVNREDADAADVSTKVTVQKGSSK